MKSWSNLSSLLIQSLECLIQNFVLFFQGFASQNPMTQQRPGGHSGLSGLSQTGMSQMDFSQDMMRSSVQDSATGTGMLSQDSTYQGNPNATGDDGGFLSQLWTTFEEELDIEKNDDLSQTIKDVLLQIICKEKNGLFISNQTKERDKKNWEYCGSNYYFWGKKVRKNTQKLQTLVNFQSYFFVFTNTRNWIDVLLFKWWRSKSSTC